MLEYTKVAVKQTVDDFKKVDYIRNLLTQILYIAYLIYALIARSGILVANIILLLLSVSYFVFFLIATQKNADKKLKTVVKTIFTRCKQIIKFFTLGVMVYGIWLTANDVTPLSLLLSALMIAGFVLQIVFEIIIKFFTARINLIIEGLEADYENMTKPVRSVGNFFKKITGKEVEEKDPSKTRMLLDKKVLQVREEKKEEKLRKKQEKKEARFIKKQAKKGKVNLPPVQAETAVTEVKNKKEKRAKGK